VGSGSGLPGLIAQEGIKPAGGIELGKVVESADMPIINVDLRNSAPSGAFHHFGPSSGLEIDANLVDVRDTFSD
jgi:hypothetical protein